MKKRTDMVSSVYPQKERQTLPKFGRMRRTPKLRPPAPDSKHPASGIRHREYNHIVKWTIGLGTAALLTLIIALLLWSGESMKVDPASQQDTIDPMILDPVAIESPLNIPDMLACLKMVEAAVAVTTPQSVDRYFHTGETSANEVVRFLEEIHSPSGILECDIYVALMDQDRVTLDTQMIKSSVFSTKTPRIAILSPDPQQVWKVDFGTFARSCQPSWPEILANPADGGIVRVHVARDNYFNGPFSDQDWHCVKLTSPDLNGPLYGYCRKTSPVVMEIGSATILAPEQFLRDGILKDLGPRVILKIKQPEGALTGQFEITDVLAKGWFAPELSQKTAGDHE